MILHLLGLIRCKLPSETVSERHTLLRYITGFRYIYPAYNHHENNFKYDNNIT